MIVLTVVTLPYTNNFLSKLALGLYPCNAAQNHCDSADPSCEIVMMKLVPRPYFNLSCFKTVQILYILMYNNVSFVNHRAHLWNQVDLDYRESLEHLSLRSVILVQMEITLVPPANGFSFFPHAPLE